MATVSHELRTPLTSIAGYIELLLEGSAGPQSDRTKKFLEIVQINNQRLMVIINDLLDMSRIRAGNIRLVLERLELKPAIDQIAEAFAPQIASKQQELRVEVEQDLPSIMADRGRVLQMLSNLISNAHKFTPREGTIVISAFTRGEDVQICVSDSGVGLAANEQTELFSRFYRAQNSATKPIGGTGLGLAITRALVELHGGSVGVESTFGAGSTFTISLPAASTSPTGDLAATSRGGILVIEERSAGGVPI